MTGQSKFGLRFQVRRWSNLYWAAMAGVAMHMSSPASGLVRSSSNLSSALRTNVTPPSLPSLQDRPAPAEVYEPSPRIPVLAGNKVHAAGINVSGAGYCSSERTFLENRA